jgi:hypothetical protein
MRLFIVCAEALTTHLTNIVTQDQLEESFTTPSTFVPGTTKKDVVVLRCVTDDGSKHCIIVPDFFNYVFCEVALGTASEKNVVDQLNKMLSSSDVVMMSGEGPVATYPCIGYSEEKVCYMRLLVTRDKEFRTVNRVIESIKVKENGKPQQTEIVLKEDQKAILSRLRETKTDIVARFLSESGLAVNTWVDVDDRAVIKRSGEQAACFPLVCSEMVMPYAQTKDVIHTVEDDSAGIPHGIQLCSFYVLPRPCLDGRGTTESRVPFPWGTKQLEEDRGLNRMYGDTSPVADIVLRFYTPGGRSSTVRLTQKATSMEQLFLGTKVSTGVHPCDMSSKEVAEMVHRVTAGMRSDAPEMITEECQTESALLATFFVLMHSIADVICGWKLMFGDSLAGSMSYIVGRAHAMRLTVPPGVLGVKLMPGLSFASSWQGTVNARFPNTPVNSPVFGVPLLDLFHYQAKFRPKTVLLNLWHYYKSVERWTGVSVPKGKARRLTANGQYPWHYSKPVIEAYLSILVDVMCGVGGVFARTVAFSVHSRMGTDGVWSSGNGNSVSAVIMDSLYADGAECTALGHRQRDYVVSHAPELREVIADRMRKGLGVSFEGGRVEDVSGERLYVRPLATLDFGALYARLYIHFSLDHTNMIAVTQANRMALSRLEEEGNATIYAVGGQSNSSVAFLSADYIKTKKRRLLLPVLLSKRVALRATLKAKSQAAAERGDRDAARRFAEEEQAVKTWIQTVYGAGATQWMLFSNFMLSHAVTYLGRIMYYSLKTLVDRYVYVEKNEDGVFSIAVRLTPHPESCAGEVCRLRVERGDTDGVDLVFVPDTVFAEDSAENARIVASLMSEAAEQVTRVVNCHTIHNLLDLVNEDKRTSLEGLNRTVPGSCMTINVERICQSVIFHNSKVRSMKVVDSDGTVHYLHKGCEWSKKGMAPLLASGVERIVNRLLDIENSHGNSGLHMRRISKALLDVYKIAREVSDTVRADAAKTKKELVDSGAVGRYVLKQKYKNYHRLKTVVMKNDHDSALVALGSFHRSMHDYPMLFPGEHIRYVHTNYPMRHYTTKSKSVCTAIKASLAAVGQNSMCVPEFKRNSALSIDFVHYMRMFRRMVREVLTACFATSHRAYFRIFTEALDKRQVFAINPALVSLA